MTNFTLTKTEIPDVILLDSNKYDDARGYFMELHKSSDLRFMPNIVQTNYSYSKKGVFRGLHFQLEPKAQGKLVNVIRGRVVDVAVDLRRDSSWFGRHIAYEIYPGRSIWVPPGFAHGFQALEESYVVYFITNSEYSPAHEGGIAWNDPELGIRLPMIEPLLSEKDKKWPKLKEAKINFSVVK
ncbi:MAG: dTDP-4-dehydrorhamnose 3,5-epimerase [Nitrososphaerota archaeon]|nr:dTDP-4-dehydrorhamnose 3,5-epimerase [Nitrososphaerota archaeon]